MNFLTTDATLVGDTNARFDTAKALALAGLL